MSAHSVLSPSSAHRRVRCPGSLAACKGIPNPTSEYAAEGTAYHEIAANTLNRIAVYGVTQGWHPTGACTDWVGAIVEDDGFKFIIDSENAAHAQAYVDYVRRIPGTLLVEVRLDTAPVVGVEGQGGTGDAVVLDFEHRTIHVVDLKFGRGEQVFADDNEQLLEYGAAAWVMYDQITDWAFVQVHICQPRIGHFDSRQYTIGELRQWIVVNRPKEQEAYRLWENGTPTEIRAALVPGEKQCRWCPLKASCPARSEKMLADFPITATALPVKIETTDAEVAAALGRVDDLEDWCRAIRGEALARATAGRELPGWKIVVGRAGARKWADATQAEDTLKELLGGAAYKPADILSPTEAEKKLKKLETTLGNWSGLAVTQADGKPSLARIEDKREALAMSAPEFGLTQEST